MHSAQAHHLLVAWGPMQPTGFTLFMGLQALPSV